MSNGKHETLGQAFAELKAERAKNWAPEQLAKNRAQRRALVTAFDPASVAQVGDVLDRASLVDGAGRAISLDEIVAHGPAVFVFFRFAECPADNLALPLYDATLWPALSAVGVSLIAVSPQSPDRVHAIGERHGLRLTILTDPDNGLARALGLTFTPIETPTPPPSGWIGEITGTGTWELPQTSVLILDQDRRVRFHAVSPDWLDRVEATDILAGLRGLEADRTPELETAAS